MDVNSLLGKLQKLKNEGYGDLQVRIFADHGQTVQATDCCCLQYIEDGEQYNSDAIADEDLPTSENPTLVVEIS